MPYTIINLTQAIAQLSARLNDSGNIHWGQTELKYAIVESLRIFQALTGFFRQRIQVPTVANQTFYDLRITNPTEYAFTVTDNDLLAQIEYHFLEPATNPWTGTAQFDATTISAALDRARNQYLTDTGIYVGHSTIVGPAPPQSRITLPQTFIDIRRAAWLDADTNTSYRLVRTDEYAMAGYSPDWNQSQGTPYSYSVALTPPLSVQISPNPTNSGTLDLCSLDTEAALLCDPLAPVQVGVPNDVTWGVKYGAMADLLSEDGPAVDSQRAEYCRSMYDLAKSVGTKPVTLLQAQIQNTLVQLNSIDDFDGYQPNWQNATPAAPTNILQVAPNLFALTPTPDAVYNLTFDLVRSMPVPVAGIDFLEIQQSSLEAILDFAQHNAMFKLGGEEFQATMPLRANFLRLAALMNQRLRANIFYNILLNQPAARQDYSVPRLMEATK